MIDIKTGVCGFVGDNSHHRYVPRDKQSSHYHITKLITPAVLTGGAGQHMDHVNIKEITSVNKVRVL